jgi:hypothetical protein
MLTQFRGAVFTALLTLAVALPLSAVPIRVSQESAPGAGDFDSNILGIISSFDAGAQTPAEVYNYTGSAYHGTVVPGVSDTQQTFFVVTSSGLALFNIYDVAGDSTGGNAFLLANIVNSSVTAPVRDDINETVVSGGGTTVTGTYTWLAGYTDGAAVVPLTGNTWAVFAQNSAAPTGIGAWNAVGVNQTISLFQDTGRRVRFDIVPEPGAIILLSGGLLGLAWFRRRRS